MKWANRLKRGVAPGLGTSPGGLRLRPNTGMRQGLFASRSAFRALFAAGSRVAANRQRWARTTSTLVQLAWPITIGMLGETALGLVDTKLVGRLGAAALGGVGMANVLIFLGTSVVMGLMRGVKVHVSYAVGEGRRGDAIRYAQAGLILGGVAGVILGLAALDMTRVLELLRIDASMLPYARDFLRARAPGLIGTCANAALIQHRQGLGDSRTPMVVGIVGNIVNAALAYSFIYGRFGLPALGVRGAGYGTATTEVLELAALLALTARERERASTPSISIRQALVDIGTIGGAPALQRGLELSAFTAFTAILGSFGAVQMAAHQIAMATIRTSFLPGFAIAEAASVLVAQALGRKRLDEADRVTGSALGLGVGFMSLCGVAFGLFGAAIAGFLSNDPKVIEASRQLLLVAAAFQTLDAVNIILRLTLIGAKDVRWVAVVGTTVVWTCIPGAAFVLGMKLGWGALGGWMGFLLETTVGSFLFGWRWARGPWRMSFTRADIVSERIPALTSVSTVC
jgi:multidrug resistance protein, MATE family